MYNSSFWRTLLNTAAGLIFWTFGVWHTLQLQNMAGPYFGSFGARGYQPTSFGPRDTRGVPPRARRTATGRETSNLHSTVHIRRAKESIWSSNTRISAKSHRMSLVAGLVIATDLLIKNTALSHTASSHSRTPRLRCWDFRRDVACEYGRFVAAHIVLGEDSPQKVCLVSVFRGVDCQIPCRG